MAVVTAKYDLAIFDMDGTLINSEPLSSKTITAVIRDTMAIEIDDEYFAETYGGHDLETMLNELVRIHGVGYPDDFRKQLADAYVEIAKEHLKPTANAEQTLDRLGDMKKCVASNGESGYIKFSLETVNLLHRLDGTFSVEDVERAKPFPDVFLHAAEQLGVEPSRCIVVEDRAIGIEAALAAGMDAVGFTGNAPSRSAALDGLGVPVVNDLLDFAELATR